ncbi:nitrilase-related carbon-nitrogen hydrolase, partial [Pseudonocardia acaciae]|uniref:nitrilase-related carbon-nitrogen hydrolase n=1 Tax=Pseudonocardia acaciae TaxID=551276 RepID=UPI00056C2E92
MRITMAQVDAVLGDIDANVERAEQVIGEAVAQGTDLIVFPELHITGYDIGGVDTDLSIAPDDDRLVRLSKAAGRAGVLLGFVEAGHGIHTYNSSGYYVGGELVHLHRKLYLPTYRTYEERKHFTPGPTLRAFETEYGRMATLICNDAWQPPLAFIATQDGARVLLVPTASAQSNFPRRYDSA